MPAKVPPGKQYRTKNTDKLRTRISVEGQERSILAYREAAKRSAAQRNALIAKGWRRTHIPVENEDRYLHDGIKAMADVLGADEEQYRKIEEMDENVLMKMYQNNQLTFEVFFNYEGINEVEDGSAESKGKKAKYVSAKKKQDLDWFIRQYDKVAGSL